MTNDERSPNSECRNTTRWDGARARREEIRIRNLGILSATTCRSDFGFRVSFGLRISVFGFLSSFVIRHLFPSPPLARRSEKVAAAHPGARDASRATGRLARFALLEEGSVAVLEILQLDARDFLADEALDRVHVPRILANHQRKGV